MAVTRVQHVTQAASEGLSAKFGDLCDPHDLVLSTRPSKRTISKFTAKSRASSKAIRQLRNQDRRMSATDDDGKLMSFIPLTTEPSALLVRRSIDLTKLKLPLATAALQSPRPSRYGVTKRLLKLCLGSRPNKYSPLPVY